MSKWGETFRNGGGAWGGQRCPEMAPRGAGKQGGEVEKVQEPREQFLGLIGHFVEN